MNPENSDGTSHGGLSRWVAASWLSRWGQSGARGDHAGSGAHHERAAAFPSAQDNPMALGSPGPSSPSTHEPMVASIAAVVVMVLLVALQLLLLPWPTGLWMGLGTGVVLVTLGAWHRSLLARERGRAGTAAARSALLSGALESASAGLVLTDAEGNVLWVNRAFAEMTGYSAEVWTGSLRAQLVSGDRPGLVDGARVSALRMGNPWRCEERRQRRDGTGYLEELILSPIRSEDGALSHWVAVARDLTQTRRLEAELRDESRALGREMESRMAQLAVATRDLEMFAYAVSHDLRAPLRAIDFFGQELKASVDAGSDAVASGHLGRVLAARYRMALMIDGLMTLFHLGRGELRVIDLDLGAMAEEIVDGLRREYPGRTVEVTIQPGMKARGDYRLVLAALTNLIGNAWKFTGKKAVARIEVGQIAAQGVTAYYVRDDGVGFDMAYADRLFTTIRRLHTQDEFEGNGIGLVSVHRVVQRHQGRIWVEAVEGRGATFYFTLEPGSG